MGSIRILNDGDRFYVVIENPSEKDKQAALDFVAQLTGVKAKEEKPESAPPAKVEPFTVPENVTEVNTSKEELSLPYMNSPKVFTEWYLKADTFSEENKNKIIEKCKFYMLSYLKGLHRYEMEKVKKFMIDFELAMQSDVNAILKKNGYSNLKAFLETEGDTNVQAAYDYCKKKLCRNLGMK